MADAMAQFALLLREAFPLAVQQLEQPEAEDVFWSLAKTFKPVDAMGRDISGELGNASNPSDWFADYIMKTQSGGTSNPAAAA